jgi:hypothetical protein
MSSRFDYIKYDVESMAYQERIRHHVESLDILITNLGKGRSQSEALTNLENFYAWAGKSIRDAQIARRGPSADVPERGQPLIPCTKQEIIDNMFEGIVEAKVDDSFNYCEVEVSAGYRMVIADSKGVIVSDPSVRFMSRTVAVGLYPPFTPPPLPDGLKWKKVRTKDFSLEGYYVIIGGVK